MREQSAPDESVFPPPEMPLRAVAFDLDGLMFNTEDLYEMTGAEVLRRRGKEFTAELMNQMIGRPSPIALQLMIDFHKLEDTVETIATESAEVFSKLLEVRLCPLPGLLTLLASLHEARIPRAVVTSSSRHLAERVLTIANLADGFEFVITAEDIRRGKPDPEPYEMAASRFGVSPCQMLVLEDSANGARAAVASGAYTIAVPSGHTKGHEFPGVKFVAESLQDRRIVSALGLDRLA